jgi:hypothetical protein
MLDSSDVRNRQRDDSCRSKGYTPLRIGVLLLRNFPNQSVCMVSEGLALSHTSNSSKIALLGTRRLHPMLVAAPALSRML